MNLFNILFNIFNRQIIVYLLNIYVVFNLFYPINCLFHVPQALKSFIKA